MMRPLKIAVPASILAAGLLVPVVPVHGKPEYAKSEKKSCITCHVKTGAKELNDVGKYYKEHNHSLDGYKQAK